MLFSYVQQSVSRRFSFGFGVVVFLLMGCAVAGLVGASRLGKVLQFVSGPAWNSADSTMETVIHLNAQALVCQRLLAGEEIEKNGLLVDQYRTEIDDCISRIREAEVAPRENVDHLVALLNKYNNLLDQLKNDLNNASESVASLKQKKQELAKAQESFQHHLEAMSGNQDASRSDLLPERKAIELSSILFSINNEIANIQFIAFSAVQDYTQDTVSSLVDHTSKLGKLSERLVAFCEQYQSADRRFQTLQKLSADLQMTSSSFASTALVKARKALVEAESMRNFSAALNNVLTYVDEFEAAGDEVVDSAASNVAPLLTKTFWTIVGFAICSIVVSVIAARWCTKSITTPLSKLVDAMQRFGDGKINTRLDLHRTDELGEIAEAFNVAGGKLTTMINRLASAVQGLAATATQVTASANHLADGVHATTTQSSNVNVIANDLNATMQNVRDTSGDVSNRIDSVTQSIHEMTATITEISKVTHVYARDVSDTRDLTQKTTGQMQALMDAANSIGQVIGLINDFAEQTNLLALNATIEAARAGDAGRGFAVVASEVKSLATQTAKATANIRTSIDAVQTATMDAVASIKEISTKVGGMSETTERIAAAITEQSVTTQRMSEDMAVSSRSVLRVTENIISSTNASNQITLSVEEVDRVAKESSSNVELFQETGKQLLGLADQIEDLINQFDLSV